MSDERLRELERRWKESGSVEDEAAYLQERVRTGDLSEAKLDLATYCNHEAARIALEMKNPAQIPENMEILDEWVTNLVCISEDGLDVFVRSAISAAQSVIVVWERYDPDARRLQLAITATTDCLLNPSKNNIHAVLAAACAAGDAAGDTRDDADAPHAWVDTAAVEAVAIAEAACDAASSAADAASSVAHVAQVARDGDIALAAAVEAASTAVSYAADASCAEDVHRAITQALIPWALGHSDPLRESVESRTADPPRT